MSPVLPAVCAALAVALVMAPGPRRWPAPGSGSSARIVDSPEEQGLVARWRWLWSGLAALGAWSFVQGPLGPLAAVAAAAGVLAAAARAESPAVRRRRELRRR
ncbi:MAG: type II secretion system protein, partial [Nocardioides sp.]|nr:type II secretion system protein [Nocardioides sp.]